MFRDRFLGAIFPLRLPIRMARPLGRSVLWGCGGPSDDQAGGKDRALGLELEIRDQRHQTLLDQLQQTLHGPFPHLRDGLSHRRQFR